MQRSSNQDADGTTWATAGLRLGQEGADYRRPTEPPSLADLVNARFLDERTVRRRDGHLGEELRDGDVFPPGPLAPTDANWVYGHGHNVTGDNRHYPIHRRGAATFRLDNQHVAWTGDRLLIPQSGGAPDLGSSAFWARMPETGAPARGIPAHLPLIVDTPAPAAIRDTYVQSCLTASLRVYAQITGTTVTVTSVDRASGTVLDSTNVTGTSVTPTEPTVINSGGTAVLLFLDTTDQLIRVRYRTGEGWTAEDHFGAGVIAYDVAPTSDGFVVAWTTGTGAQIGRFIGVHGTSTPYLFGKALPVSNVPNSGPVAVGVDAAGFPALVYQNGTSVYLDEFLADASIRPFSRTLATSVTLRGASVAPRLLPYSTGSREWTAHLDVGSAGVVVATACADYPASLLTSTWPNSYLVGRTFRVGDEVFAWLRSGNSGTCYLLCGARAPYVSGFSDREVGVAPDSVVVGGVTRTWPARVLPDPVDTSGAVFSWSRRFTVIDAAREGDVLDGVMDFLPQLSTAVYGRSVYLSGSAVKNWDGRILADAGFQDYPVLISAQHAGGSLAALGTYEWRAHAVRYNDQGERFESAAVTIAPLVLTGANQSATVTVYPPPAVSTDDYVIEVYRTESLGTTFYLDTTLLGPFRGVASVSYVSTQADAALRTGRADPHAAGLGVPSALETFGPIGCAVLATVGDRLWSAGGQVGAGVAQFSTLKSVGQGAGFDDLAGYVQVDNQDGEITSIAELNNAVVIFERNRIYALSGDGPDNFGIGGYAAPDLRLAAGATTHFGTALTQMGVLYWGTGGPLLLDQSFRVENVSSQVRPITEALTPVGVQVDTARMEVVWYTGNSAVLLNYMADRPRWARWFLPDVAGVSDDRLITFDGRLLAESADAHGDDSIPFAFRWKSGNVRSNDLLEGFSLVRRVGVLGQYDGPHQLRFRTYFDGSPLWSEESIWAPETGTWLVTGDDLASSTPSVVDALVNVDRSGAYASHKRLRRQTCHYLAVEVSDVSSDRPTYTPFELSFELGSKPGLGRTPVNTYSGQDR